VLPCSDTRSVTRNVTHGVTRFVTPKWRGGGALAVALAIALAALAWGSVHVMRPAPSATAEFVAQVRVAQPVALVYSPRRLDAFEPDVYDPASLAMQLRSSDDFYAFIESARRHPQDGSYYYALKAFDFCNREAKVGGRIPALDDGFGLEAGADARRFGAAWRIALLCRRFFGDAPAAQSYVALTEEGRDAGDPLLALARRLEALSTLGPESADRRDAQARSELFRTVFAQRDGWLLRDLAGELRLLAAHTTLTLDGETISAEESPAFFAAFDALACELSGPCGGGEDPAFLLACANAGDCDAAPRTLAAAAQAWRQKLLRVLDGTAQRGLDLVPR